MIWLALLLAQAPAAPEARGAKIFAQSCAVGYCHGSGGSAGRAPRITGRGFERPYVLKVVRGGIGGTGMPGFQGRLGDAEIAAVVNYVVAISGGIVTEAGPVAARPAPPAVERGRELFFDAVRGTRCSTCHALEGRGIAIGPNLGVLARASAAGIRKAAAPNVRSADIAGDRFPALLVEQKEDWLKLYDLTKPPPVLRTVAASETRLDGAAGGWSHAAAIAHYTDAELASVAEYLRWLASR
jgi:mono/diheme cytochrome c family protein